MFRTIDYLKSSNGRQKQAYTALIQAGILKDLAEYDPVLCGTIPLGIDVETSDLDIIMEVYDLDKFELKLEELYGGHNHFIQKRRMVRGRPVSKANFVFGGFEFELFGQPQPVRKQYAYLHMLIQYQLLSEQPDLKEKIIGLKQLGYKTEPAFYKVLGLEGDPYDALIQYGEKQEII